MFNKWILFVEIGNQFILVVSFYANKYFISNEVVPMRASTAFLISNNIRTIEQED